MFEIITLILFVVLCLSTLRLTFRLAWGIAKVAALVLFATALPVLAVCLFLAGGFLMLVPLAIIGIAFAIVRACI